VLTEGTAANLQAGESIDAAASSAHVSTAKADLAAGVSRCLDVIGGAALIFLGLPVIALAVTCILVDDGRPFFYWSPRLGRGGEVFNALKLRTMRNGADRWIQENPDLAEEYAQHVKLENDPRVTRIGGLLRRLSIDELPQAINIIRGDMGLVGPRPGLVHELERWGSFAHTRLSVRPGLTGLWQISGRNILSYDERLRLDSYYIQHRSVWFDIKILIQTIPAVLSGRGAT
jgi:exopolysaccharide production protein ExoY